MKIKLRSLRFRVFWGIYFLGASAAVGGNDTAYWLTGHPMSNWAQTIVLVIGLSIAGLLLSSAAEELRRGKS